MYFDLVVFSGADVATYSNKTKVPQACALGRPERLHGAFSGGPRKIFRFMLHKKRRAQQGPYSDPEK